MEHCGQHAWKLRIFTDKNFVKTTFLIKKFLKNWFHGKNFGESCTGNLKNISWNWFRIAITRFFRQTNGSVLLKKLQMSWFHGNILQKMINLIFSWLFPYYNVEDFSSNQLFSKSNVDFTEKVWEWISMYIHMYVQFLHCALIKYQITSLGTTNKRTKIHYSNSSSIYNLKTQVRICRLPRNWNYYCSS